LVQTDAAHSQKAKYVANCYLREYRSEQEALFGHQIIVSIFGAHWTLEQKELGKLPS
jgi:hypothetical protein